MSDILQTIVAGPWNRRRGPVITLLLLLIAVAGGIDAIAFVGIGGVFVTNQTGNLVFLSMGVAGTHTGNTAAAATSLVCFVAGAMIGGRLLPRVRRGEVWPSRTSTVIAVEVALIVGGALLSGSDTPAALVVWPMAIAMGLQAALAQRMALEHLTGGFITGATAAAAMTSPVGDRSNRWWWYVIAPVTVLAAAAGSVSVVADHTVPGALVATAFLVVGAWWLSRSSSASAA